MLWELRCLPVQRRIEFKMAVLVYKALNCRSTIIIWQTAASLSLLPAADDFNRPVQKRIGGGRLLLPEILGQTYCIRAKSPIFYLFSPVAPQP